MSDLIQLHRHAREIFGHALVSVDPRKAVRQAISLEYPVLDFCGSRVNISSRKIYAVALGKAATSMAQGLDEAIGEKITCGLVSSPLISSQLLDSNRWQTFNGGHPFPNEASLEAARCAFAALDRANAERALVIFLVSGGGSAMLEWPVSEEITLADLRRANQALVTCGARISEVNSVRRAFSAVKGGALARRAPRAQIVTLIVSDTNRGDEASVASGPTLPPPADAPEATDVIRHYHLESTLPASILRSVQRSIVAADCQPENSHHHVLIDNFTAMEAAGKKALDFVFAYVIPGSICEQPIQEGCDLLLSRILPPSTANEVEGGFCLISGGEFSCPVTSDGRGGRNLETALRCAIGLDQNKNKICQHIVVLSAGTDGIDGNSPAAGAIADETTIDRARELGLDPNEFLARSDSYVFFEQLNDLILTGPTGTNVRDLRILLRSS